MFDVNLLVQDHLFHVETVGQLDQVVRLLTTHAVRARRDAGPRHWYLDKTFILFRLAESIRAVLRRDENLPMIVKLVGQVLAFEDTAYFRLIMLHLQELADKEYHDQVYGNLVESLLALTRSEHERLCTPVAAPAV